MRERGISAAQVEDVLRRPLESPAPGSRPDTVVYKGHAVGVGELKVVVDVADHERVVSVYWTESRTEGTR